MKPLGFELHPHPTLKPTLRLCGSSSDRAPQAGPALRCTRFHRKSSPTPSVRGQSPDRTQEGPALSTNNTITEARPPPAWPGYLGGRPIQTHRRGATQLDTEGSPSICQPADPAPPSLAGPVPTPPRPTHAGPQQRTASVLSSPSPPGVVAASHNAFGHSVQIPLLFPTPTKVAQSQPLACIVCTNHREPLLR